MEGSSAFVLALADGGRSEDGFEDVGVKLHHQAVVLQLAVEVNPLLCRVDK